MAKSLSSIPVVVKWVGDEKEYDFGKRKSVLCIHQDYADDSDAPDTAKYWIYMRPSDYGSIPDIGITTDIVQAGKSKQGKPYYSFLRSGNSKPAVTQPSAGNTGLANSVTLDHLIDRYRQCLSAAGKAMADCIDGDIEITTEAIQAGAATLMIASKDFRIPFPVTLPADLTTLTKGQLWHLRNENRQQPENLAKLYVQMFELCQDIESVAKLREAMKDEVGLDQSLMKETADEARQRCMPEAPEEPTPDDDIPF
jgi:hypothetical protein